MEMTCFFCYLQSWPLGHYEWGTLFLLKNKDREVWMSLKFLERKALLLKGYNVVGCICWKGVDNENFKTFNYSPQDTCGTHQQLAWMTKKPQ